MKRCPQCNRVETDDALTFCRADGPALIRDFGSFTAMLTAAAAAVGEIDQAMVFAQQALDEGDPLFVLLARTWPDYENVRTDSRFLDIVSQLGLPGWSSNPRLKR
jgi:hypothetical protein